LNKHQKEQIKLAKGIMKSAIETAPMANFRIARIYVRHMLSFNKVNSIKKRRRKTNIFMSWYIKKLKGYQKREVLNIDSCKNKETK
jgi:hypothetical protein